MNEPDKDEPNTSSTMSSSKDEAAHTTDIPPAADQEKSPAQTAPTAHVSQIFNRLNQVLTNAASSPAPPKENVPQPIRIPRAPARTMQTTDRDHVKDNVIRIPRRSVSPEPPPWVPSPSNTAEQVSAGEPIEQGYDEPAIPPAAEPMKIDLQSAVSNSSAMLPLIDRMEQQVNKATANLMARVEQVLSNLEHDAIALLQNALADEQQDEADFSSLSASANRRLDDAVEDVSSKILDSSASGQQVVQNILEIGKQTIDQQSAETISALLKRSKVLRMELGELTQAAQKKFNSLVKQRAGDIHSLIEVIREDWQRLTTAELQSVGDRGRKAYDLINQESESISNSFEQYCQSLDRDLDEVWEQASYEIDSARKHYTSQAQEALKVRQQHLAVLTKSAIDSYIVPHLKTLADKMDNHVEELRRQFLARYESDLVAHMAEIETQTNELKQRFKLTASVGQDSIYDIVAQQTSKISQLFADHRDQIQISLRETEDQLESMQAQIKRTDAACRKLLISSGATLGLSLAGDRDQLILKLQELRKSTLQALKDRLHDDTMQLEELSVHERSVFSEHAKENIRTIREKCRAAMTQIQAEVEKSFQDIQKERERFLL